MYQVNSKLIWRTSVPANWSWPRFGESRKHSNRFGLWEWKYFIQDKQMENPFHKQCKLIRLPDKDTFFSVSLGFCFMPDHSDELDLQSGNSFTRGIPKINSYKTANLFKKMIGLPSWFPKITPTMIPKSFSNHLAKTLNIIRGQKRGHL